jgi:hypothetical protein
MSIADRTTGCLMLQQSTIAAARLVLLEPQVLKVDFRPSNEELYPFPLAHEFFSEGDRRFP